MRGSEIKVEVLYFEGCPHFLLTMERVREALIEETIDAAIAEVEVSDAAAAERLAFVGSPSVRVDGLDVEVGARTVRDFGLGCRSYVEEGRRTGTPSLEMIRRALREVRV